MSDTPRSSSTPTPQPPAALQCVDGDHASRFHTSDPHGDPPDAAVPESDSAADTQGPKPIEYARQLAMISDAVLAGVIPPHHAQAAATSLRSSYDVLYASSRARGRSSSAGPASSDPTKAAGSATPGTRTAGDDQMRTIIDVFLTHAPDQFHAIEEMLTDADRGYVQTRFTTTPPQEPSR